MESVGILLYHEVVPLGGIERLTYPLGGKIKTNIPAGIDVARKRQVEHISVSSAKEGSHFREGRLGIVELSGGRVLEIQVVGIKARTQPNLFRQPKENRLGGRSNVSQILILPTRLGHRIVVVKIVEQRVFAFIKKENAGKAVNSVISNVGKNAGDPMQPDRGATPHKSKVTIAFAPKQERGAISSGVLLEKLQKE